MFPVNQNKPWSVTNYPGDFKGIRWTISAAKGSDDCPLAPREITSDLPACGRSRLASSSIRVGERETAERKAQVAVTIPEHKYLAQTSLAGGDFVERSSACLSCACGRNNVYAALGVPARLV
jgi:hypothetical protein